MGTPADDWLVAPGYGAVADAFRQVLEEDRGLGSALAVVVDGTPVLDLWGGHAHRARRQPWRRDTIAPLFSGTKGIVAVALLQLVERGTLDLDAEVAAYWPAYATAGKQGTLVRHVVSHLAGVPGLRAAVTPDDLLDDRAMAALLAAQEPLLEPGTAVAYHPLTFGWLCNELVRGADGRPLARYVAEEIVRPLGLDAWIGLPQALEERVARLTFDPPEGPPATGEEPDALMRAVYLNPDPWPQSWWNTRGFRAASIPGGNGLGTARAMARLYGCLARGGELDGMRLLDAVTVALGRTPLSLGVDAHSGTLASFGVGFQLAVDASYFGPVTGAFGHGGVGGGRHGAWPERATGFSFLPSYVRDSRDERAPRLLAALAAVG